jgi:hypothetical protein
VQTKYRALGMPMSSIPSSRIMPRSGTGTPHNGPRYLLQMLRLRRTDVPLFLFTNKWLPGRLPNL